VPSRANVDLGNLGNRAPARTLRRAALSALLMLAAAGCQTTAVDHGGPTGTGIGVGAPNAAGSYLMARQAYKVRDLPNAATHFEAALNKDPENHALIRRAFLAELEAGNISAAVALAERGERVGVNSPFMHMTLGLDRAKSGDWAKAQDFFLRLPKSRLNDVLGRLLKGWAAAGRGDWALATATFEEVRALPGFEVLALLHAGHAARLEGKLPAADKAFNTALTKAGTPPLRLNLAAAIHFAATGRPEEARRVLDRRSGRDYDETGVAEVLRRAEGGETVPGLVGQATDGMAEALFDLASALQRERGNNAAMVLSQLALHMRPRYPLAQLLVGEILDDRGKHERALSIYRRISGASAYHTMARLREASSLQDLGRVGEAVALLRDFATTRPGDPTPWMRIGDMQRSEERWADAVAAYDEAARRIPDSTDEDWTLFYTRGIALERAQQWERAEADFLRALELSPDQPYVMNYLGYSWTEQGINLSRAERMIEKAVRLRPNDGYIIDSLGWVLYRTGRFDEAVPKLERAVQLRPNDPTINDHLGDAYWRVGRQIEAMFQWRRALAMEPEAELLAEIEKKLKGGPPAPVLPAGSDTKADAKRVPGA